MLLFRAIKFYDRGFMDAKQGYITFHSVVDCLKKLSQITKLTIYCIKLKLYRVDFSGYLNNVNHGVENDYNLIPGIIEWYS